MRYNKYIDTNQEDEDMTVQWTVSFEKAALNRKGLELLEGYEHEEVNRMGKQDVDMSEEEFFSFAEEAAAAGVKLPTDGSDSWGKHI